MRRGSKEEKGARGKGEYVRDSDKTKKKKQKIIEMTVADKAKYKNGEMREKEIGFTTEEKE